VGSTYWFCWSTFGGVPAPGTLRIELKSSPKKAAKSPVAVGIGMVLAHLLWFIQRFDIRLIPAGFLTKKYAKVTSIIEE
jgi:hypothetical protein